MNRDLYNPSDKQKDIERKLRDHPKGGREISIISNHILDEDPLNRVKKAQLACIDYVERVYSGDVSNFLNDYKVGKISYFTIIEHIGRTELGLSPERKDKSSVYT